MSVVLTVAPTGPPSRTRSPKRSIMPTEPARLLPIYISVIATTDQPPIWKSHA
jgi:hypothetical protein